MSKGFDRTYSKGRYSGNDGGDTPIGIAADTIAKRVIINHFKQVRSFGFDFESGFEFLVGLAENLSKISGEIICVGVKELDEPEQENKTLHVFIFT